MLVAVVGAGMGGLIATKNCLEEGLDVVCLERDSSIGGLWRKKDDSNVTTCMDDTMTNFSKHRMAVTDFVFPDETPLFPRAADMLAFLEAYAKHFDLMSKIKFNVVVTSVDLYPADSDGQRFIIQYTNSNGEAAELIVNRLIVATGLQSQPFVPTIAGLEHFKGETLHSRGFRSGSPYKDKKVLVVGSRSSAADVCTALVSGGASEVLMSHKGGLALIPRIWRGKPFDWILTRRLAILQGMAESLKSYSSGWMHNKVINFVQWTSFTIKKEWGISPTPDTRSTVPTITDTLVPLLNSGQVVPVPGISSILPDSTIVLTDGRQLSSVDAIIFATGFESNPAATLPFTPAVLEQLQYNPETRYFPRYKFKLSMYLPELFFISQAYAPIGAPVGFDISTMWMAGVWSGDVQLPSIAKMIASSEKDKKWVDGLHKFGAVTPGVMPIEAFFSLAKEAGCADDHLQWFFGSSWAGWKWWWSHRALSRLVLDGPDLPAAFRLRGRKKWEGAEDVIWHANGKDKKQAAAKTD